MEKIKDKFDSKSSDWEKEKAEVQNLVQKEKNEAKEKAKQAENDKKEEKKEEHKEEKRGEIYEVRGEEEKSKPQPKQ